MSKEALRNFWPKAWQVLKTQILPMIGLLLIAAAFMGVARMGGLLGMVLFIGILYGVTAFYKRRMERKALEGGSTTLETK